MPLFTRPAPSRPSTPPPDLLDTSCAPGALLQAASSSNSSSWDLLTNPSTAPSPRPSTPRPFGSWDMHTFAEKSNCLPNMHNGDWRANIAHPIDTAASIHSSLTWHSIRETVSNVAEHASDSFQDRFNHAFQGQDLPAMHDRVLSLLPRVSMPSLREVSRSFDSLTDSLAEMRSSSKEESFVDEELAGDHLAFARHVGAKARRKLVQQGICWEWQVVPSRATMQWRARLDDALIKLFREEKKALSIEHLFKMTPIWIGDADSETWRLQLDTGLVEIVVEAEGDNLEEKAVYLKTGFELPECCGCVRIADYERQGIEAGEWMAING